MIATLVLFALIGTMLWFRSRALHAPRRSLESEDLGNPGGSAPTASRRQLSG